MAALLGLVALASPGCQVRNCDDGSLFVELTVTAAAERANQLRFDATVGTQHLRSIVPYTAHGTAGSVRLDFPHGYPRGQKLDLVVTALTGTTVIASGTTSVTLSASCARLAVTLMDTTPGNDLSVGNDLARDGGTPGVTLLAGTLGGSGNADDVGPVARFNIPMEVASDGMGNLMVTDGGNFVLRKIVLASGAVTTFAGAAGQAANTDGTGSAARFVSPHRLALDGAGNLFVSDWGANTIRRVVLASAAVTTFAGTAGQSGTVNAQGAAARFSTPDGIVFDGMGNLYVADYADHTIRKIDAAANVTTVVGAAGQTGSTDGAIAMARFNGPSGLALDANKILYVSDANNSTVRSIDFAGGMVATIAGTAGQPGDSDGLGTASRLRTPTGLTFDGIGLLYLADFSNGNVRSVALLGGDNVKLVMPGLANPQGVFATTSEVYIADSLNHVIRKVVVASGAASIIAGSPPAPGSADGNSAQFNQPNGVATDGAGSLYVADTKNHTIRKVDLASGAVSTQAGLAGKSGTVDGPAAVARFTGPTGLAFDRGLIYVSCNDDTVRRISLADGMVTTLAGSPGVPGSADGAAGTFSAPQGIVADGMGNLYVADTANNTVRQITIATKAVSTLAGTAGMSGSTDATGAAARFNLPTGIAVDGMGNLFVTDLANATIRQIVIASGVVTTLAGTAGKSGGSDGTGAAALFSAPDGIALAAPGLLVVTDAADQTLRTIDIASGTVVTIAGVHGRQGVALGKLPGGLSAPGGVTPLGDGRFAVSVTGENAIVVVHP
jgi:sugar lactone lactonase YvrE